MKRNGSILCGTMLVALPLLLSGLAANSAPRCPSSAKGEDKPWLDRRLSAQCRARLVVASFRTAEEKLDVLTAPDFAQDEWLASRGLPVPRGSDGPAGINDGGVAVTSLPLPLSIAATFDESAAARFGNLLGSEFFDFGYNRIGGPSLDMTRTWRFGRSGESFGEDPLLSARIGAAQIQAITKHHVVARVKHFVAYTQEAGRTGDHPLRLGPAVNVVVSERALREVYLPPFEAAVKAGAGEVMCAFPRINGHYACEHPYTLRVLKQEWGFDGVVVPDYPDAQRSIIAAVNAGLDRGVMTSEPATDDPGPLGIPIDNVFNGESLRAAAADGTICADRIDDMLMRRLVPYFRIGAFDHPARRSAADVSTPARRAEAVRLATEGAVLLKNDSGVLPFGSNVRSVALIGEQAGPRAIVNETGSAYVAPMHLTSSLAAVTRRAGASVKVRYARGTLGLEPLALVPPGMVTGPNGAGGFRAEYFANADLDFSGKPFLTRQEQSINNTSLPRDFPKDRRWSARWTGQFTPATDGVQHFTLFGSGTARLFVDAKEVGRFTNTDFSDTIYADLPMRAGVSVEVRVEWTPRVTVTVMAIDLLGVTLGPVIRLGWEGPNDLISQAAEAARQADVAVVVVGHKVGEGMARESLALPGDQNALIDAVAAANPRTVVVLQTGGAVTMPWLSKVAGALHIWLPGDATGPALANLLFGDSEPGGRLPVTFPRDERQGPGQEMASYPGVTDGTGALATVHYDEDVLVGYRFWDAKGQEPLFPFGYGLSYTTFGIRITSAQRVANDGVDVALSVRNTGQRRGTTVVQLYLGYPDAAGQPPKQLKGFSKLSMAPGQIVKTTIRLPAEAFRTWNEAAHGWTIHPGNYRIMVGTSSREIADARELQR